MHVSGGNFVALVVAHRKSQSDMGKRGPKLKKGAPPPPQKPEGAGKMRTPTSAYDPAASKDVYEPEKIIGQRLSKGTTGC